MMYSGREGTHLHCEEERKRKVVYEFRVREVSCIIYAYACIVYREGIMLYNVREVMLKMWEGILTVLYKNILHTIEEGTNIRRRKVFCIRGVRYSTL
jgi:hypothetical protein